MYRGNLEGNIRYVEPDSGTASFTEDEINIFHLYFEKNMSLEKISEIYQTSRETIRRKINMMKERIRRWYT